MAFTDDDIAYLRSRLGTTVSEDNDTVIEDLELRYDRLGALPLVALEVARERLADLQANPLQFSVPGEYSEDRSNNVALLQRTVADLADEADVALPGSVMHAVRPPRSRWRR